jgi:hypothetical protein
MRHITAKRLTARRTFSLILVGFLLLTTLRKQLRQVVVEQIHFSFSDFREAEFRGCPDVCRVLRSVGGTQRQ